jgi:ribonuclease HII
LIGARLISRRAYSALAAASSAVALGVGAPVHERIVRGDATSASIAAASIVAKAARDRLMARLGERYPGYGFERNAGYWTAKHMVAREARADPHHRLSFNTRRSPEAAVAAPARSPKRGPCLLARTSRRDGRPPARDAHDRRVPGNRRQSQAGYKE